LDSIHLARLYCDAAKHQQQWKVRLIRDPEFPVARYIDITHVASSFPGGAILYASRFQSAHIPWAVNWEHRPMYTERVVSGPSTRQQSVFTTWFYTRVIMPSIFSRA